MSKGIRPQHIDLTAACAPLLKIDIPGLCLKGVLITPTFFDTLCDEVFSKLEWTMQKMYVLVTLEAQKGYKGSVEFALGQRINIVSDSVV